MTTVLLSPHQEARTNLYMRRTNREKNQSLCKNVQENECLEFRNQQLNKRVIATPTKKKKKVSEGV